MEITSAHIAKIHALLDAGLVQGLGVPEPGKMCVEAAICYALDLPHSDDPGCVHPALRQLKIRLNDGIWSSNKARADGMRRLAIAQLGSKDALDAHVFASRCATLAIRMVVPFALRGVANVVGDVHGPILLGHADKCESNPTTAAVRRAADAARSAAYASYAAYAAYAAARSAYAAAIGNAAPVAADAADDAACAACAAIRRRPRMPPDSIAADDILSRFAEGVVQILIDMNAPGVKWL
jgi:hypothetical protein